MRKLGLFVESEKQIAVEYDGQSIGEYFADILVENKVILEIKATKEISSVYEAQLVNYLKATSIDIGLLLNFGPSLQIKRKIFETGRHI